MAVMTLSEYLQIDGNSASRLGQACGVAVSTITRAARGEIMPSRRLLEAIFHHTGGQVTPNDFFEFVARTESIGCHGAASTPEGAQDHVG